jgi:hypothetical protein
MVGVYEIGLRSCEYANRCTIAYPGFVWPSMAEVKKVQCRSWELIKYETKPGYFRRPIYNGFEGNLGLICSCWKEDFEKTNGFPNYWGWGVEDETLYKRALKCGINIDESNMLNYKDDKKVINPNHYRNAEKERASGIKNKDILNNELKNGENLDGLTNIQYEVISSFEMAPRFRILNVDFKLKAFIFKLLVRMKLSLMILFGIIKNFLTFSMCFNILSFIKY